MNIIANYVDPFLQNDLLLQHQLLDKLFFLFQLYLLLQKLTGIFFCLCGAVNVSDQAPSMWDTTERSRPFSWIQFPSDWRLFWFRPEKLRILLCLVRNGHIEAIQSSLKEYFFDDPQIKQ